MKIVIKDINSDAIQAALDEVNGKGICLHHQTTTPMWRTLQPRRKNALKMPASPSPSVGRRKPSSFPPVPTAKSYKFGAQTTRHELMRAKSGSWSLVGVARVKVYPKQNQRLEITIDSEQADIIREHALAGFRVTKQVAA